MEQDIRDIVEPHSQVDPKFQSDLAYSRITAEAVRNALINNKGYKDEELPTVRTMLNIINRLGFTLKKVQKSKPLKKLPRWMKYSTMSAKQMKNPITILNH